MKRFRWFLFASLLLLHATGGSRFMRGETIARCGNGWLERIDGYPVLHLKGTAYEMGRQHGVLLREDARENLRYLIHEKGEQEGIDVGPLRLKPRHLLETIIKVQRPFVPEKYFEELRGLADGMEAPLADVQVANFIPEMFHCSGFAVMNSATQDGTLYHGRVLDYAIDWRLQEHAVIIVAEPADGIAFVNVTYAGFVGSVTGMNARGVAVGEMGGAGIGHWEGMPMAFLVRDALERAESLDAAIAVFRDTPKTCQYFYVISDAKTNRAVGMEASWDRFELIQPGQYHSLLPHPVKDAVVLSAGDRYEELAKRIAREHGKLTAQRAIRLMDRPVAMSSNLHNALFEPATGRFWVANATKDRQPAADQKYHEFNLKELLARHPEP